MEAIWKLSYPANVKPEITLTPNETFLDIWADSVKKYPDQVAFSQFGTHLTFSQVNDLSLLFANYLISSTGLKPGDRFAIILPNLLQYPVVLLGAWRAGLVVVNVNPLYSSRELSVQLSDAGAAGLIILENFAHTLAEIHAELKNLKTIIITQIGDLLGFLKKPLVNFWVRYGARLIPPWKLPNTIKFPECFRQDFTAEALENLNKIKPQSEQTALLQYTGGTTGASKGAVLTHRNLVANMHQILGWIGWNGKIQYGKETVITALPLYHIFALTANCLTFMALGARNILILNPKDTQKFVKILKKTNFTVITGVNTLYRVLLNHPDFKKINFKNLNLSIAGGMALQEAVAEQWQSVTGKPLIEGYGLTEASPVVCFNRLDLSRFNHSIGLPLASTEVSIRDSNGVELKVGEIGELWVRGPQVMREYWQRPDETEAAFGPDGWLKTGDLARMDSKGYLFLVDRKKEMIIISGFNVYPTEVENIIAQNPGVLEVGVTGEQNEQGDERVVAYIVRRYPELTESEIIQFCEKFLARYKIPKKILFRTQLPKSPVGKILRRKLSESQ